jgi:hypothetical protein
VWAFVALWSLVFGLAIKEKQTLTQKAKRRFIE